MATALSGTGPTYLFAVMEALIDAGVHLGFPRELAHDLVVETLIGSAEYAARSELHPAQLRNLVTSPGGTSAAAIYELEKGRIRTVFSDAVWAAYRRTLELGERLEAEVDRELARPMFAIVMAGGAGTRLWPLSRRDTPKQLLALTGDTSLLQQTVARLGTLLKPHDIYVITSQAHVRATQRQLPQLPEDNVLGRAARPLDGRRCRAGDRPGPPRERRGGARPACRSLRRR